MNNRVFISGRVTHSRPDPALRRHDALPDLVGMGVEGSPAEQAHGLRGLLLRGRHFAGEVSALRRETAESPGPDADLGDPPTIPARSFRGPPEAFGETGESPLPRAVLRLHVPAPFSVSHFGIILCVPDRQYDGSARQSREIEDMKKSGSGPGIPGESPVFREQIVPQGETRLPRNEAPRS